MVPKREGERDIKSKRFLGVELQNISGHLLNSLCQGAGDSSSCQKASLYALLSLAFSQILTNLQSTEYCIAMGVAVILSMAAALPHQGLLILDVQSKDFHNKFTQSLTLQKPLRTENRSENRARKDPPKKSVL